MGDVEEEIRWDLEFDKVRDKDDLGLIMEDACLLSDDIQISRVQELFDFRNPLSDELKELGSQVIGFEEVNKGLKRKFCDKDDEKQRKRVCGDVDNLNKLNDVRQRVLSYDEKLEKAKRKLREGYDLCSRNRKTSRVISLKEVGSKRKLKTVVTTANTKMVIKGNLKGKQQCYSNQNKVCKESDEKKGLKEVLKFSYAERVEMAKAKLQQGYDRCTSERKKTCVISLEDIPKPAACRKRVVGRFKRQHCLPVSNTIRGY